MEKPRELFDYFEESNRKGFKVNIGNFLSHDMKWIKENGQLLSVEEVNNLDRMSLATQFIKKKTNNGKYKIDSFYTLTRKYELYELENDIAQFIDLKIPKNYWIRLKEKEIGHYTDRSSLAKEYTGIISIDELKFWYDDNYLMEFHW